MKMKMSDISFLITEPKWRQNSKTELFPQFGSQKLTLAVFHVLI